MKLLGSISVVLTMWAGVPTGPFFSDSRRAVDADPSSNGGYGSTGYAATRYAAIRSLAPSPGWAKTPDPMVDSARAEFEAGRYWHASQILREHGNQGAVLTPSEVLLLARADAGWKNWDGVLAGLEGADWLDGIGSGEGRLLVARALEAAERWDEAAQQYERFRSTGAMVSDAPWAQRSPALQPVMSGRPTPNRCSCP